MNNIDMMLEKEIEKTLDELAGVRTGSEEAKAILIKLSKLHDQHMKQQEVEIKNRQVIDASIAKSDENRLRVTELENKLQIANQEAELKKAELAQKDEELKEAKRGRRWRTALDILGIGAPLGVTAYWMAKGMKFEEEGKIYSSRTSQWVGNLMRMFKKG